LVYWIRCETRVKPPTEEHYYNETNEGPEQLFRDEELQEFYRTRVAVIDSKFVQSHHPMKIPE
jgi:hypothetical protein